jgi:mRNA interferase MazF
MVINQGDIYWITLKEPKGSEPGYRHPHVVIQNNLFNRSLINTVLVCALTSNLKRAKAPGNILLDKGEANLPKKSVIIISHIFTVNKDDLSEKIGSLTRECFKEVYEGIKLITEPREVDDIG